MSAAEMLDEKLDETLDEKLATSNGWREFAICKGQLHLFFGRRSERPQERARREAKAMRLCTVCVVQGECRQYARQNREYGFWGAESEEDRHIGGFTVTAPIGARARPVQDRTTRPADDDVNQSGVA